MEKQRKIIIVSLAASLMAVILYVFGLTLAKGNIIIETLYLVMASLLVVSAVISLFNNYKKYKTVLYIYLIIINVVLEALFIGNLFI
ncbi:hypothetical protein [uncultured Catenibacterium sp.]|uniref:hypothetical protein n=1 Tax=uncultured Catenibacterium sp. TaxID=286142 RepID=UPI0025D5FB23|nr:hypothetical protein [uncultured Catenibacterium sp.]